MLTNDLSDFGQMELKEASKLLSKYADHKTEIPLGGKVELWFNTVTGLVYLSDDCDINYSLNREKDNSIERYYICDFCFKEGFGDEVEFNVEEDMCENCLVQAEKDRKLYQES